MPPRYVRPCLEVLEDRTLLAAYTFIAVNGPWNVAADWQNGAGQNGVPVAQDSATIPVGDTCIVTAATNVGDLTVNGTLNVNNNLTVAANNPWD